MWGISIFAAKFLKMEDGLMGWDDAGSRQRDASLLTKMYGNEEEGLRQPFSREGYDDSVSSSRSHCVDVPHVRQLCNWDCGLACVLMVLRTFGMNDFSIHDLEEFCCTTSIWTVDLAYLLKKFSIKFSFFTVTLGANPDFSSEAFYKEQLHDDRGRVNTLFEEALEAGIRIEHRSLSGNDISLLMLSGGCIAIALVDKYKLRENCHFTHLSDYSHFIVICGYDGEKDEFDIRDPASSRKQERIPLACLEVARKSFGTDEDILLPRAPSISSPRHRFRSP
ncbi:unnamed protein product [Spirodela intermedia]|uniref:Uncharacterized protein n=1 Tax=Spirodela intermedia TaxID=51605 RepID=A0A7I8KM56_SPIIN|nr:unnamed protein product [Spirodela intermedia]